MNKVAISVLTILLTVALPDNYAKAKDISIIDAELAVNGWLNGESSPLGLQMSDSIEQVELFKNDGNIFYGVYLDNGGVVIVSGDDRIEPVIAFFKGGKEKIDQCELLWDFICSDMHNRYADLNDSDDTKGVTSSRYNENKEKWESLFQLVETVPVKAGYLNNISDIRVSPLLMSVWSQTTHNNYTNGQTCYNYYTPSNYPSGCVATAMAQIMKFWQYPMTGPVGGNTIKVNGSNVYKSYLGGTLPGGAYDFNLMPDNPALGVTLLQRQEIGRLCFDAGVSVAMSYTSGGSSSYLSDAASALGGVFNFTSAKYAADDVLLTNGLYGILNPNLDAGQPLILGILDSSYYSAHAVVVDGYGYNYNTMYHHLNMGWAGYADLWYNLPTVSYSSYNFDLVTDCVYNISPFSSGEIISGRLTDEFSTPMGNVTITASDGVNSYTAITGYNGIYSFINMPSNTDFVLTGDTSGLALPMYIMSKHVSTGQSGAYDDVSGNCWVDDMIAYGMPQMPIAIDQEIETTVSNTLTITLDSDDDGFLDPIMTGVPQYVITRLPAYGTLTEPGVGTITSVPHALNVSYNTVIYNNTTGNTSQDDFAFAAEDFMGVTEAGIYINIPFLTQDFEFNPPFGWNVVDGSVPADGASWGIYNVTSTPKISWSGSNAAMCISYDGSSPNDYIVSPAFDTAQYMEGFRLRFGHVFRTWGSGTGFVEITNNGSSWAPLPNAIYTTNTDGTVEIDVLPSVMPGVFPSPNVQIRWRYSASYDMYWGIDDICLYDLSVPQVRLGDIDYDRDIDLVDMQLLSADWLSSSPIYNTNLDNFGEVNLADFMILAENWLSLP